MYSPLAEGRLRNQFEFLFFNYSPKPSKHLRNTVPERTPGGLQTIQQPSSSDPRQEGPGATGQTQLPGSVHGVTGTQLCPTLTSGLWPFSQQKYFLPGLLQEKFTNPGLNYQILQSRRSSVISLAIYSSNQLSVRIFFILNQIIFCYHLRLFPSKLFKTHFHLH